MRGVKVRIRVMGRSHFVTYANAKSALSSL